MDVPLDVAGSDESAIASDITGAIAGRGTHEREALAATDFPSCLIQEIRLPLPDVTKAVAFDTAAARSRA